MAAKGAGLVGDVQLIISENPLQDAAALVVRALSQRGAGARFGVPGGSAIKVIKRVRETLSTPLWNSLRLTWVDERLAPEADPNSNRGEALREGALSLQQPPALELPLVLDGETGTAALERVQQRFERDFEGALDVALLGLGEDGHVASLFPRHPVLASHASVALVYDSPKPPSTRITLTLPVLARPEVERIIVAMGATKREALERLLERDETLPAVKLGRVTVVTNQPLTSRENS